MSTSPGLSAKVRELARRRPHLCTSLLRSPSWRASAMTSQMTISATLRVLLKGALNTGTPMELAACTGTVKLVGSPTLLGASSRISSRRTVLDLFYMKDTPSLPGTGG